MKVAIVGANGNVGSELSLLLSLCRDVELLPIVRSAYAGAYLRHCGLQPVVADSNRPRSMRRALQGVDAVVDCSLDRAATRRERRQNTTRHLGRLICSTPRGTAFVYLSSTMAFGMDPRGRVYRRRLISRTVYAGEKRHGERVTRLIASLLRRRHYVFRLGQVHGHLQPVTTFAVRSVISGDVVLDRSADHLADAVFCSTVAQAIIHVGRDRPRPSTYTLVEPDLTWADFYRHIAARLTVETDITDLRHSGSRPLSRRLKSMVRKRADVHREELLAHLPLGRMSEQRLRGFNARTRALVEMKPAPTRATRHIVGPVPGRRLPAQADLALEEELSALLEARIGVGSHNYETHAKAGA